MQVVILAAGLGSRLGDMTTAKPKALIEAGGKPLIHYAVRFARAIGGDRIVVVGGFHFTDVRDFVADDAADVTVVDNAAYRKGNLISLQAGLAHIDPEAGFQVMNTDHIYRPSIAERVRAVIDGATEISGFCDFDRELGADDMKVQLNADKRITAISKNLDTWDAGYVGMTWVPGARAAAYQATAKDAHAELGEAIHVEAVLARFAAQGQHPHIGDISGHGWLEVDEPSELAKAEETLAREAWWS